MKMSRKQQRTRNACKTLEYYNQRGRSLDLRKEQTMAKKLKVKPKTKAKTNKYTGNRNVASAQVVYGD